jgi:hypothetical protein
MAVPVIGRRRARLAVAAVGVFAAVLGTAIWMGSLRVELHLDDDRIAAGEPVRFDIAVCSSSPLPMRTDDGKPSWEITDETGEVVADSSHQVFTLELKTLTWSPRQCRTALSVEWDQREWNQRALEPGEVGGLPRRGDRVPAGTYELTATWGELDPQRRSLHIVE